MRPGLTRGEVALVVAGFVLGGVVGPALLAGASWVLAVWLAVAGAI